MPSSKKPFQDGVVFDRFVKAVRLLADANLAVRLGGIYALGLISLTSARYNRMVMEILTAYVRERSPWPPTPFSLAADQDRIQSEPFLDEALTARLRVLDPDLLCWPRPDIQAILRIIGRRPQKFRRQDKNGLNLAKTDLRGADLTGLCFDGVNFEEANFRYAKFRSSRLHGTYFFGALLDYADLRDVHGCETNFGRAHLVKANFGGARLPRAKFHAANLREANFCQAQLPDAKMDRAHLGSAWLLKSDLRGVRFMGADLKKAKLMGANLEMAYFLPPSWMGRCWIMSKV